MICTCGGQIVAIESDSLVTANLHSAECMLCGLPWTLDIRPEDRRYVDIAAAVKAVKEIHDKYRPRPDRKKYPEQLKPCKLCGEMFIGHKTKLYCSKQCRHKYNSRNQATYSMPFRVIYCKSCGIELGTQQISADNCDDDWTFHFKHDAKHLASCDVHHAITYEDAWRMGRPAAMPAKPTPPRVSNTQQALPPGNRSGSFGAFQFDRLGNFPSQ